MSQYPSRRWKSATTSRSRKLRAACLRSHVKFRLPPAFILNLWFYDDAPRHSSLPSTVSAAHLLRLRSDLTRPHDACRHFPQPLHRRSSIERPLCPRFDAVTVQDDSGSLFHPYQVFVFFLPILSTPLADLTDADCGKAFSDTRSFKPPPTTAIKRHLGNTASFDRISTFFLAPLEETPRDLNSSLLPAIRKAENARMAARHVGMQCSHLWACVRRMSGWWALKKSTLCSAVSYAAGSKRLRKLSASRSRPTLTADQEILSVSSMAY